jgi:hypothetical protein
MTWPSASTTLRSSSPRRAAWADPADEVEAGGGGAVIGLSPSGTFSFS